MNQFGSLLKRRLLSKELSIPAKKCKNKGVQTYSKEKQFALKSFVQDRSSSTHGSLSSNCTKNPFRFSPPQYNINGSATLDEIIEKQDMLFTPKSNIITPPSKEKSEIKLDTILYNRSTSNFTTSKEDIGVQYTRTPVRTLFYDSNIDEGSSTRKVATPENNVISLNATGREGTPMPITSSSRLQRSVGRVKSYKEPSLTVKVRKGFKFFTFEEKE